MTRRTFFASLAGVAVVRALPPAPLRSSLDADLATLDAQIRNTLAELAKMNVSLNPSATRPTLEFDQLGRYLREVTREHHARLEAARTLTLGA